MTENKRFTTNNGVFYKDNETGWEFQSYGEVVQLLNKLNDENKTFREALRELKEIGDYQAMRIKELDDENQKLKQENEQLKQVLGSILIEVKQEISAPHKTGEIRAFINPKSYDLISDVLKRYGALKGWYDD